MRRLLAVLLAGLGVACATPPTQPELEARLEAAAAAVPGLGRHRVIPIYADSRIVAVALRAEAERMPDSPLSRVVSRRLALTRKRRIAAVVGGSWADLSDQVLRNALALTDTPLAGLTLLYVSPATPSSELAQSARAARIRLIYRRYQ